MSLHRLGVILLIVGVALGSATLIRGMNPFESGLYIDMPDNDIERVWYIIPPRNLRLDITCSGRINLSLYSKNDNIQIFMAENVSQGIYRIKIPRRGVYCFIILNPSNLPTSLQLGFTLYGFEGDLLNLSVITLILGSVIIIFTRLHSVRKEDDYSVV